jgi:hypothetical protein
VNGVSAGTTIEFGRNATGTRVATLTPWNQFLAAARTFPAATCGNDFAAAIARAGGAGGSEWW